MSHRPTSRKQVARLRKALRRTPDAYIDLIHWLKLRGHAQTTGQAKQLLIDGKVRSNSHPVGRTRLQLTEEDHIWLPDRFVPARLRDSLIVG